MENTDPSQVTIEETPQTSSFSTTPQLTPENAKQCGEEPSTSLTTNNDGLGAITTQQHEETKKQTKIDGQNDNIKSKNKPENSLEQPIPLKEFLKRIIIPKWFLVPNKVSEARDMLATERTMLTWYRTAFSILGIGIAVSRIKKSDGSIIPKVIGGISCSLAMLLIMYAHLRYYVVLKSLFEYHFSADTLSPPFILLSGAIICVIAVLLFFV